MLAPATHPRSPPWTPLVLPLLLLLWGFWQFQGFVQDDAFISLRFAANLARGEGLVFNPGERVEGFTNMLWTLLGGLTCFLGLPTLKFWQLLGVLSSVGTLVLVYLLTFELSGLLAAMGAATVFAASTTVHAWSGSGMEAPFFTMLLTLAVFAEHRGHTRLAFGVLGVAQWTRPEALLAAGALVYVKLRRSHTNGTLDGGEARGLFRDLGAYLLPTLALFGFRWLYFGTLVPNTYLVKGAGVAANHLLGLRKLEQLALFGGTGLIWILTLSPGLPSLGSPKRSSWPLWLSLVGGAVVFFLVDVYLNTGGFWRPNWSLVEALQSGTWDLGWTLLSALIGGFGIRALLWLEDGLEHPVVSWSFLIWLGTTYYFVRVGGDLLPMHRLYMAALPFQALLAGLGAARLAGPDGFGGLGTDVISQAELRGASVGFLALLILIYLGLSVQTTASQRHFRSVQVALDRCHGQAGRDLQAIAEAHGTHPTVLAQDMGALPLNGMDLVFIDSIGLCDGPIARILWEYRYSPYFRYLIWEDPVARARFRDMEEKLRTHLTEVRKPDYAVINVHLEAKDTENARRAAEELEGAYFYPFLRDNAFFYKWTEGEYFQQNYVLLRAYEYSTEHFLVTFRRKDQPGFPPGV